MSQENVEVAVRYFEATDLAEAIGALAEDVTFVFHGKMRSFAGAETVSGRKAAIDWLTDWFSRFDPDYRMEIEESRDWGDRVLVVTDHRASGRASGIPISMQTGEVLTMRDGKIIRQDFFASRDEALEAAGLQEEAMSQENDELVRQVYALLSSGEVDQALGYTDPDVVMDWSDAVGPTKGVYRGHAEARAFWSAFVEAWGEVGWVVEETVAIDPERVIAVVTVRGRGRGSGAAVAATGASIWTIADGKLQSAKLYQSKAEALEAAGLE